MAENNPILSVISKFQSFFNLPTTKPVINNNNESAVAAKKTEEEKPAVVAVRVPRGQTEIPPSLRLEGDERCPDRNTNPVVLWQVYAIGGFFVVRWVLARLNERRNKKKPSDEEPSDDEEPSPNDD